MVMRTVTVALYLLAIGEKMKLRGVDVSCFVESYSSP